MYIPLSVVTGNVVGVVVPLTMPATKQSLIQQCGHDRVCCTIKRTCTNNDANRRNAWSLAKQDGRHQTVIFTIFHHVSYTSIVHTLIYRYGYRSIKTLAFIKTTTSRITLRNTPIYISLTSSSFSWIYRRFCWLEFGKRKIVRCAIRKHEDWAGSKGATLPYFVDLTAQLGIWKWTGEWNMALIECIWWTAASSGVQLVLIPWVIWVSVGSATAIDWRK